MPTTKLLLVTGEQLEIEGSVDDAARALENAARSSAGTLAWVKETVTDEALGVNPAHVVTLRAGEA
jgi:hypothetical protein